MASRKSNIQKQIAELQKNLELIEVRKSEYVQPTDIPLQLIKTEEETRAKLAAVRSNLLEIDDETVSEKLQPKWLLLAGFGVVLTLVGVLLWLNRGSVSRPQTPADTDQPVTSPSRSVETVASTQNTSTGTTPALTETIQFPPLPEYAPALTTTVLLLNSTVCADEQKALTTFLADTTNTKTPPVILESRNMMYHLAEDRPEVRNAGQTMGADLVIWCTDEGTNTEIHFEALTQRAAPEVYEPPTLSMPIRPADRSQRAALGVINYLRRDYVGAEPTLQTAAGVSEEETVAAAITLLIGNCQTFLRDYVAAANTYSSVIATHPEWAFAWHNLGAAKLNAAYGTSDLGPAQAALEEARKRDPNFDMSFVLLARISIWLADENPDNYAKALAFCAAAAKSTSPAVRAQATACKSQIQLAGWNIGLYDKLPRIDDPDSLEDSVSPYWAEPLALLGAHEAAYWSTYYDPIARKRAQSYFLRYLIAARSNVLLEESRLRYASTIDQALPQVTNLPTQPSR